MAGAAQVARLSAFTAMGSATRAIPSAASDGNVPCNSCSSMRTRSTCWHRRRPVSVARQGWSRITSAQPTRSSSRRMRWEMADGVTCSARAARSKLPSRTTAAKADKAA
ncbi:hypothetical protein D3C81_1129020 [compost metagenome]